MRARILPEMRRGRTLTGRCRRQCPLTGQLAGGDHRQERREEQEHLQHVIADDAVQHHPRAIAGYQEQQCQRTVVSRPPETPPSQGREAGEKTDPQQRPGMPVPTARSIRPLWLCEATLAVLLHHGMPEGVAPKPTPNGFHQESDAGFHAGEAHVIRPIHLPAAFEPGLRQAFIDPGLDFRIERDRHGFKKCLPTLVHLIAD